MLGKLFYFEQTRVKLFSYFTRHYLITHIYFVCVCAAIMYGHGSHSTRDAYGDFLVDVSGRNSPLHQTCQSILGPQTLRHIC